MMIDREKIEALVNEGGMTKENAYFMLIDMGEFYDDGSADKLFPLSFLETYPA